MAMSISRLRTTHCLWRFSGASRVLLAVNTLLSLLQLIYRPLYRFSQIAQYAFNLPSTASTNSYNLIHWFSIFHLQLSLKPLHIL
ncbi:hypothetical protein F5Y19DRAFT_415556 [Xylariaceae sp. FL1651]|nr:hypothetical protein F5Y19DRAFT_415556 [Xylariaceae sp. FL1651]